jgi:hypothetical protein
MHPQFDFALGTAAGYLIVESNDVVLSPDSPIRGDMLFCRTARSNFIDYSAKEDDFSFEFYGNDGLMVNRNKHSREKMSFNRFPGRLVGVGQEVFDLDYLWMTPQDARDCLVFADAERNISFWKYLKTDKLD